MIFLLDNYDSFTYNLLQYLCEMGVEVEVRRNDKVTLDEIAEMAPERIVISPGPGRPEDAGISLDLVRRFAGEVPILGVCLGHQAIGVAFGAKVVRAPDPVHGKTSLIQHDGRTVYEGLPEPFEATRYHSLVIERHSLPDCFEISAEADGLVMGLRHKDLAAEGVQFHPESILTKIGKDLLANYLGRRADPELQPSGSLAGAPEQGGETSDR